MSKNPAILSVVRHRENILESKRIRIYDVTFYSDLEFVGPRGHRTVPQVIWQVVIASEPCIICIEYHPAPF
jgi:hypothetical protein